ncbi:hypothetical protein AVEN_223301-1 [Araneus ventricosus]|uniref:Uncharacterized protein n=1 Tax=Araneus ventricosus TaxID=182803 RepID=A0A4Y2G8C4_ARAVE|nr:hypothetical protein AVEN_223301-1 [Araneus ventricosus]
MPYVIIITVCDFTLIGKHDYACHLTTNYMSSYVGHVSFFFTWNERADTLAKNVTESDLYIEWIAVEDVCSYYSNVSLQKPIENLRNSKYLEILGDLPSILSLAPWLKNIREDIIITRILTRMIITTALLHRFGGTRIDPLDFTTTPFAQCVIKKTLSSVFF